MNNPALLCAVTILLVHLAADNHVVYGQTCSASTPCQTKACCSKWGNCGYGPDFCGDGCVNTCDAKPECGEFADKKDCPLKVCCSKFGFCGTTKDFCTNGCQGNCGEPVQPSCSSGRDLLNIGYYASWSAKRKCQAFEVKNIDPRNYTHLNYAFGEIKDGVMVRPSGDEEEKLRSFVGLKNISPSLKVLISVGGWAFNDPGPTRFEFHNICKTKDSRSKFINSVRDYLSEYSLDGIDIDYEYPGADDRGGSPEDTENYLSLVAEMRDALGSGTLITIAAPASYWYLRHFKIGEMSKHLDWINIMTYDIHGVWDKGIESLGPFVNSHTDIREIKQAIDLFLRDGVKPEKMVLGLALYGRAFTLKDPNCRKLGCEFTDAAKKGRCTDAAGTLADFEIEEIRADKDLKPVLDKDSMTEILSWDDQWVAYDNEETLAYKRNYASTNCMKGVMFWSIDMGIDRTDGENSLMATGSVAIAHINLEIGEKDQLKVTTTRDARDGFDLASITVPKDAVEDHKNRVKRQSSGNQPVCNAVGFVSANLFFAIVIDRIRHYINTGMDDAVRVIRPNDPDNPIEESYVRRLPNGAERVGLVLATYTPRLYRPNNRLDFPQSGNTSTTYMRNNLDATTSDERGHIVANFGSGPPVWYNMVPQENSVNRNYHARWILNDWYGVEAAIRSHLANNNGNVMWRVFVSYADGNSGRPIGFTYEAIFLDQNGNQVNSIFGVIRNCPPRGGLDSNNRCIGM